MAFVLRFDLFNIPPSNFRHLQCALPIWVIAKALAFRATGLQRGWWQCVSIEDVYTLVVGNILGSAAAVIAILSMAPPNFPRSIYFLDFLICLLATTGVRVFSRAVTDLLTSRRMPHLGKPTLIYGAGMAGRTLLREIRSNVELKYKVCGFLDDDPRKADACFLGVTVHGPGAGLQKLIRKYSVEQVLIALPSATGKQMAEILDRCHAAGVKCRTMPALGRIIQGRALTSQIRDVAVEDLLGRAPVTLESNSIRRNLLGQVVMVTGAGGSIGSEICRQAAGFSAPEIVAYEVAETALFHLDREIRRIYPDVVIHPEIGSIQDRQRLAEVMAAYKPSILYHAAAYKHVPMMEAHPVEAIRNNIFGTYEVAMAAAEHGVRKFVMISSDKAVRPTNVMGATKRVAELIINSLQNGKTKYMSVRFGNVLGSNGSVIPLFKEQIAVGGPVTITHPEMRRYFMTIPEAVQLVLQASTLGNGGEVFVLDMGQPVKIIDLAKTMILLSGLRPGVDINLEFTGARPGEKLFEELSAADDATIPTGHEKIAVSLGRVIPKAEMLLYLQELGRLCTSRELGGAVLKLQEIIPEYNPSPELQRQVLALEFERPHAAVLAARS
jgi:FlaA1/EpsC-like NDP-sugar epimerase